MIRSLVAAIALFVASSAGASGLSPPPTAASTAEAPRYTVIKTTVQILYRPVAVGNGYFVNGARFVGPNLVERRIRGVDVTHWDQWQSSVPGLKRAGIGFARVQADFSQSAATNARMISAYLGAGVTPIVGNWAGTCYQDAAHLTSIVDTWVAQAPVWTALLNAGGVLNVANEWGPANSTVWRDGYVAAIKRLRAAGYTSPIMVDSGNCGQDAADVVNYGRDVLAADPQRNVVFDVHLYGVWVRPAVKSTQQDYAKSLAALKATGLAVVIGEFGPGQNVGPSPTTIAPEQIVADAEANGFGWLAWAWNDNDLAGCRSDDRWFSMTTHCSAYTGLDADLTAYGKKVLALYALATGGTTVGTTTQAGAPVVAPKP